MFYINPIYGYIRTLLRFALGKVQFIKEDVGKTIIMDDAKSFKIFRRVRIKRYFNKNKRPQGLFIIRFALKMSIENIIKSRGMLMMFMGFKGFRTKYWCVDEQSGMCQGLYEWDTLEDAVRYSKSVVIKAITKHSVSGSISFKILENTEENRKWEIQDTSQEEKLQFKMKYKLA
jgi:hypothetical protein